MKEGIVLVNKPRGRTSFSLIQSLRRLTGIKKIGHTGTLDPFATGVLVILIGRLYTRLSDKLLSQDKEYIANIQLGITTDTYDCEGNVVARCKKIPSLEEIEKNIEKFQGKIEQIPPMFSAKKVRGKKLYQLARKGLQIKRKAEIVWVQIEMLHYTYPTLSLKIRASKGTYIRSIAYEMGKILGCGAHLNELKRTRSGSFSIEECIDGKLLDRDDFDITPHLIKEPYANHS